MTALSVPFRHHSQQNILSWMFSLLLHGLIFSLAITFVSDLRLAPQPEPFKWNVSLIETLPTPAAEQATPSKPVLPEIEERPVEPQTVVQTVQTIQPVQRVVQQVVRTVTPVIQQPTLQPEPVITRTAEPIEAPQQEAQNPDEASVAAVTQSAVREVRASPVQTVTPSTVTELPIRTSPAPRRDYGWLAEALWSKVEGLKRYPAMARMNRWQGKVVLKAVIKADGSVDELQVVESSGHAVLDQDALDVVRRASPLTLKHDLGQPQVVVQIPISYALR